MRENSLSALHIMKRLSQFVMFAFGLLVLGSTFAVAANLPETSPAFPPSLASYGDSAMESVWAVLRHRVEKEPFNLWATLIFLGAVLHTFLAHKFIHWSHVLEARHQEQLRSQARVWETPPACVAARLLHFLGEVEAIFGIWVVPLCVVMATQVGIKPTMNYLNFRVSYHEALFVVIIMALSSTRPVLRMAEQALSFFARLGGNNPAAWWMTILTLGPLLGSLITEPAAMTISALLLSQRFYSLKPTNRFAYATLGLLFVNISVGGVFTHFAAPPVLMVAGPWNWNTAYMFKHFGWIALIGLVASNLVYLAAFRNEFKKLVQSTPVSEAPTGELRSGPIPLWVTLGNLVFMTWSVLNSHYPVLLLGGFLFFLAFFEVTSDYQSELQLRSPILVGFFLAGLVIHGGLQQWWIGPVLGRLKEVPLLLGAIGLTAFNDNAAITYLATLVPDLSEGMKYAVVAGAVTGGGLTVIANAPNPAGQSILGRHFPEGISPLHLLLGALPATIILALSFLLLR